MTIHCSRLVTVTYEYHVSGASSASVNISPCQVHGRVPLLRAPEIGARMLHALGCVCVCSFFSRAVLLPRAA